MAIYNFPSGISAEAFQKAVIRAGLRLPDGIIFANGLNAAPTGVEFEPDLSASERAAYLALLQKVADATTSRVDIDRKIDAYLTQITDRQALIAIDRALLPTASAAQQRAIVDRMLSAEKAILDLLTHLIRVSAMLVRERD